MSVENDRAKLILKEALRDTSDKPLPQDYLSAVMISTVAYAAQRLSKDIQNLTTEIKKLNEFPE